MISDWCLCACVLLHADLQSVLYLVFLSYVWQRGAEAAAVLWDLPPQQTVLRQEGLTPQTTDAIRAGRQQHVTHRALGHIFTGFPPGEACDCTWMRQIHKWEMNRLDLFISHVRHHHCRLPSCGGIPHLQQTVILSSCGEIFSIWRPLSNMNSSSSPDIKHT